MAGGGGATAPKIRAGEAYVRITADNSALVRGLDGAKQMLRTFGQTLKGLGADMMQLSGAIALPLTFAAKTFADFDDKVRILKAITGATASETVALTSYMRELGATTAFTAEQVAQGAVELARMGFNVTEVRDGLRPIMDLVRATGTETFRLGEIASYASATMRGFGFASEQFADVCDIMGVAADNSAMDISDLGEAMKIVAPSAKTINEDIKDTAASLMLMANAGVRGSLAGTSLRKVYQSLAAQSGKISGLSQEQLDEGIRGADELRRMGISLVDVNGNLRKTNDIMADIAKKARALKSGEKINFATDIFDLRGSLGALSIMDKAASLGEFRKRLDESRGFTRKIAEDMEQGVGGAIRLVISQFKELQISIGEAIWNTFGQKARNEIVSFISAIRNLVVENKELASKIVAGIGAVFAFGVALFGLGAAIKILANVFGIASFAIKACVGTVMLASNAYILLKNTIMGAVAAIKAFYLWVTASGSVTALVLTIVSLGGAFAMLIAYGDKIPGMISTLKNSFSSLIPIVKEAFVSIRDSLAAGDMQGALKVFVASAKLAALKIALPFREVWVSIAPVWKNIWADLVAGFQKSMLGLSAFGKKAATNIVFFLIRTFEQGWNVLLRSIVYGIKEAVKFVLGIIIGAWWDLAAVASYIPGLEDWGERNMKEADAMFSKANAKADAMAADIVESKSFNVDRVNDAWDRAIDKIDRDTASGYEKIEDELNEKKKRNGEALDAEFAALQEQIDAAEKAADEAKEYARQYGVMVELVKDLKNYFEHAIDSYVLDEGFRDTVKYYEEALQSKDANTRDEAEAIVRKLIDYNREQARNVEMQFNTELEAAQVDRVIDDDEWNNLRALADQRALALKLKEEYERLLAAGYTEASDVVVESTDKTKSIGAWSSDVLNAMLNTPDEKRTADAAESINDAVLDIKRKIFSGKWGSLTYGA